MKPINHLESKSKQQGFVLAFALLLMLFVGILVISSIQKTGTETRIAQSEAPIATLQAAAEAAVYRFRKKVYNKLDGKEFNNSKEACEFIKNNAEDDLASFLYLYGKGATKERSVYFTEEKGVDVYWYLNQEKMSYCNDDEIDVHTVAFAGSHDKKIAKIELSAIMRFESDTEGDDDSGSNGSSSSGRAPNQVMPQKLIDALGRFADYTVAAGGSFTANGNRSYDGIVGSGGSMTLNGSQTINGNPDYSEEAEVISDWATMPDPRSESPGHPHFTGYIDKIAVRAGSEDDVISTCDLSSINSSSSSGKRYVYCDGDFSSQGNNGRLHSGLDGLILVAQGNFDGSIGDSIHTSIVTGGTVNLRGAGDDSLKSGVIWSAGSVALSGGPNFENLGLITNSALTINGAGTHSEPSDSGEDPSGSDLKPFKPSTEIQFDY